HGVHVRRLGLAVGVGRRLPRPGPPRVQALRAPRHGARAARSLLTVGPWTPGPCRPRAEAARARAVAGVVVAPPRTYGPGRPARRAPPWGDRAGRPVGRGLPQ